MKHIGLIDLYIDEWHANSYPAWIAADERARDMKISYVYAERDAEGGRTTDEWCREMGFTPCASIEELCERSDYILILAPSDPDRHLPYATRALPFGKPTFIDKTFAPSLSEAEAIVACAKAHGTPFFSSSALRYASELPRTAPRAVRITGGGRSIGEYIIHQIEMLVRTLGIGAVNVLAARDGADTVLTVHYPDGRIGTLRYRDDLPFSIAVNAEEGREITSDFFPALIADMLRFFEEKTPSFPTEQTLEAIRIRDMALAAAEAL